MFGLIAVFLGDMEGVRPFGVLLGGWWVMGELFGCSFSDFYLDTVGPFPGNSVCSGYPMIGGTMFTADFDRQGPL